MENKIKIMAFYIIRYEVYNFFLINDIQQYIDNPFCEYKILDGTFNESMRVLEYEEGLDIWNKRNME